MTGSHQVVLLQPTAEGQMAVSTQVARSGKAHGLQADKQLEASYVEPNNTQKTVVQSGRSHPGPPGNFCNCSLAPAALPLLGARVPHPMMPSYSIYRSSF